MRQTVEIEIDPSDFIDERSVAAIIMRDALDFIEQGQPQKAASILSAALKIPNSKAGDPEEDRRQHMMKLFREWYAIPADERGEFWSWSHGRRHCA